MTDDFERLDGGSLGENWTQYYEGAGSGVMRTTSYDATWQPTYQLITARMTTPTDGQRMTNDGVLDVYGSMPNSKGEAVGARLHHDTTCTRCGKRPEAGDVLTAQLAPNMSGTWHHNDCDDPKLQREDDDHGLPTD